MIRHLTSTATLVTLSQLKLSFRHGSIKQSIIITCCRHFHPREDMANSRPTDKRTRIEPNKDFTNKQGTSLSRFWKELHFPPGHRCFAADNIDPKEWTMMYRFDWTRIGVSCIGYVSYIIFILSIKTLYDFFVRNIRPTFLDHDFDDPDDALDNNLAIGLCIVALFVSLLIGQAYPRLVTRGYYSPKHEKFVLIRPSVLTPWRTKKLMCNPASVVQIPRSSIVTTFFGTYEIAGRKKVILYPQNFFLPAYYNVLCGYTGPRTLVGLRPDPDASMRYLLSKSTNN